MNVYLISGLGADSRAFRYLNFDARFTIHHLHWIEPSANETLKDYSKRLSEKIDTSKPFILLGLSFGGMVATEISRLLHPYQTIIISSIAGYNELPFLYKLAGTLKLHKLIPSGAGNKGNIFMYWLFGIKTPNDKTLLSRILTDSNTTFTKWAMGAVLGWQIRTTPGNIIRIHGDHDRVLPITSFQPQYLIQRGGHLMVVTHAAELSRLLNKIMD
jgi:pimeloyl-ACP methyl ester carboxylesterase